MQWYLIVMPEWYNSVPLIFFFELLFDILIYANKLA